MKHYGTTNDNNSIATKSYVDNNAGGGGVPTRLEAHLEWESDTVRNITVFPRIIIDSAISEFNKLDASKLKFVLYRYINNRSTHRDFISVCVRLHGWINNTNEYPVFTFLRTPAYTKVEFKFAEIASYWRLVYSKVKNKVNFSDIIEYQSFAEKNNEDAAMNHPMVSLGKKCAIAITYNNVRISDFMKFCVKKQKDINGKEYMAICRW